MAAPRRVVSFGAIAFSALVGCAGRAPAPPATRAAAPAVDIDAQARAVIADVVALRGLTVTGPIVTRVVDDATFVTLFRAKAQREARPKDAGHPGAPPESYLGFYDESSKTIVLRDHMPAWARGSGLTPQDLLAHEVVHALQDQHFGIPNFARIDDDDRLLALRSLYEGDAQLVALAYHARRMHRSWKHAALYAYKAEEISADVWIHSGVFSPSLLSLSGASREAVTFPYLAGTAFASALFRTGGFALLDRAFERPPESTAEVLEPQRYLAGEKPAVFAPLPLPLGARPRFETPLGELGLASFLVALSSRGSRGSPGAPVDARAAVRGYEGGRLSECDAPNRARLTLLATEWRTPEDAARFESVLRRTMSAFREQAGADFWTVARDGTSVALAVAPGASLVAPTLLHRGSIGAGPEPPFGPLALPPAPLPLADRPALRGAVVDSRYESRWLSLNAPIPAGFSAKTTEPGVQLVALRTAPSLAVASFSVLSIEPTGEAIAQLHRSFVEGVVGAVAKASRPVQVSSGPGATPYGPGTEVTWTLSFGGRRFFARSLAVEVCGGDAVFQWGTLWADEEGARTLEAWTSAFRSTAPGTWPACDDYREENAEDGP